MRDVGTLIGAGVISVAIFTTPQVIQVTGDFWLGILFLVVSTLCAIAYLWIYAERAAYAALRRAKI